MALRDVIVSMDYEAGGLKVELNIMQNWWTIHAREKAEHGSSETDYPVIAERYARHNVYDLDEGHNERIYWPPMRQADTLGTLDVQIHYIRTAPGLRGQGIGTRLLRQLQRLAMAEGYSSLIADWVHIPFYALTTKLWGWTDVLFNRETGQHRRPLTAFFTSELGKEAPQPVGPWHLTWSPPATRLWGRMTPEQRAEWADVLRFASAVQDWVAAPDPARAERFFWDGQDEHAAVDRALIFLVAGSEERIHGLRADLLAVDRVLHVRNLSFQRTPGLLLLALLNAFFVELGRSLSCAVTWDAGYLGNEESYPALLYLGDQPISGFIYPSWQPGMGAWPYIYSIWANESVYAASNRELGEAMDLDEPIGRMIFQVFVMPYAENKEPAEAESRPRYTDPAAFKKLEEADILEGDRRMHIVEEDKKMEAHVDELPAGPPAKRSRLRCYICQRLHARETSLRIAVPRLCSIACHDIHIQEREEH